jgi:hypothetical protein
MVLKVQRDDLPSFRVKKKKQTFARYSQTKENVVIVTMDMGWALFLQ